MPHECMKEEVIANHDRNIDSLTSALEQIAKGIQEINDAFKGTFSKTGFTARIEGFEIRIQRLENQITSIAGDIRKLAEQRNENQTYMLKVIATSCITAVLTGLVAMAIKALVP